MGSAGPTEAAERTTLAVSPPQLWSVLINLAQIESLLVKPPVAARIQPFKEAEEIEDLARRRRREYQHKL